MMGCRTARLYGCPYVPWELPRVIPGRSRGADAAGSLVLWQGCCWWGNLAVLVRVGVVAQAEEGLGSQAGVSAASAVSQ